MNHLVAYFNAASPLSQETSADIEACLKYFDVPKHSFLLQQGQRADYLYFVKEGLLRAYYYRNGKEVVQYFATEQHLIGANSSFFSRKPSTKIIQSIESCHLIAIHFEDIERLYKEHHDFERVGRILAVSAFLSMQERLYALQFHTAKQRYDKLLEGNPTLLQRAPLGDIASYLGINQVTLSRIRKER